MNFVIFLVNDIIKYWIWLREWDYRVKRKEGLKYFIVLKIVDKYIYVVFVLNN